MVLPLFIENHRLSMGILRLLLPQSHTNLMVRFPIYNFDEARPVSPGSIVSRFAFIFLCVVALNVAVGRAAPSTNSTVGTPTAVIETFHGALLSVMKDAGRLGVSGRYQRLIEPLSASYDFGVMTRISSGSFWRRATKSERAGLVAAFRRVSIGTYAVRFDGYSGQAFEVVGENEGPRGTTLVETRILSQGSDPVGVTYVMKSAKGAWRIIDVLLAGGVSELAVRRSEYSSVLKSRGVGGLIAALNKKADGLVGM